MSPEKRDKNDPAGEAMQRQVGSESVRHNLDGLFFGEDERDAGPLDPVLPGDFFQVRPAGRREEVVRDRQVVRPPSATKPGSEGTSTREQKKRTADKLMEVDLPAIGAIIDKYRIEELVGKGGFAAVFRATHLLLNMPVAIKLLRPKAVRKHQGLAELLWEEARFAAKINHPNVVRIYDVTHTAHITYVVMEFIEGRTLSRAIKEDGPLPPRTVCRIGLEVTAGLKAGLEQGLIHRDIKPSNILLSKSGVTKIVDLGLAQPAGEGVPEGGVERFDRLAVVGTPGYMAPEQGATPDAVDFRADIYSLGATLYQASVGQPPFPLKDTAKCISMHRHDPVPIPELIVPGFPTALSNLLLWMLAKKPSDRPGSHDVLTDALRETMESLG